MCRLRRVTAHPASLLPLPTQTQCVYATCLLFLAWTPIMYAVRPLRLLGPLHTRAKSRDHEIVRAQKKVSEGHLKPPPKSCSVVTDPQV